MGEFCAHEDEEDEGQELARRLHLLPPVGAGPAVSHADRPPRTAVLSSPISLSMSSSPLFSFSFLFKITIAATNPPSAAQEAVFGRIVSVHIQFISGGDLLLPPPPPTPAASSASFLPCPSCFSPLIYRCDAPWLSIGQRCVPVHGDEKPLFHCQKFTSPPGAAVEAVDGESRVTELCMVLKAEVASRREGDSN